MPCGTVKALFTSTGTPFTAFPLVYLQGQTLAHQDKECIVPNQIDDPEGS